MHLLESFALNTGLKIGTPYLYTSFVPRGFDGEYITLQPYGKAPARNYAYWQEVIDILKPIFTEANIKIVQLGTEQEPLQHGVVDLRGRTSYSQASYTIKNALLHLGADSFAVHAASCFQKKIVSVYSNMPPIHSGPYWSDEKDVILLDADRKGNKPSYHNYEQPPTINTIKSEDIAKSVCKLLNLKFNYPFKTLYTGAEYHLRKIELVPTNYVSNWQSLGVDSLIVRMDRRFDEEILAQQLGLSPCSVVTDRPINIQLLKQFQKNIIEHVFFVDENTDINYFNELAKNGLKPVIVTSISEEKYNKIKLKYIDIGTIIHRPSSSKDDVEEELKGKDLNNIYFKTSCYTVQKQDVYACKGDSEQNVPIKSVRNTVPQKLLDIPDFWEELQTKTLLEKIA